MSVIHASNLSFAYGKNAVLRSLSLEVAPGETVGVIGCNGAGKSTLLKLLCGILPPDGGQLTVAGLPMESKNLPALREKIGYVFQDSESQLFMTTVYEDVSFAPRAAGLPAAEIEQRTRRALAQVHIESLADARVYRLSGGQKKLAAIATVLSMKPQLLLLDEPSAALDPQNRRSLIGILNELPPAKVIACHDLDFLYDTCSRAVLLADGGIAAAGPAKALLTDKALLEAHGLELPLSFSRR